MRGIPRPRGAGSRAAGGAATGAFGLGGALVAVLTPALCSCVDDVACMPTGVSQLTVISGPGRGEGFLHQPRGIEALPGGECVVIDRSGRVQRFDGAGSVTHSWLLPKWRGGQPIDLTRGPDGLLYVSDTHHHRILVYSVTGELLRTIGEGVIPGLGRPLELVRGIAIGEQGRLYVADYGVHDRVHIFSTDGAYHSSFGRRGDGEFELQRPEGVAVGAHGDVFVVDCGHHRVLRFDRDGSPVASFGRAGTQPGQFLFPFDIATGSDECLYVVDFRGNRVQRFDRDGNFIASLGRAGTGRGEFATPRGVAVLPDPRGDLVMVADTNNHRVQRFRWEPGT